MQALAPLPLEVRVEGRFGGPSAVLCRVTGGKLWPGVSRSPRAEACPGSCDPSWPRSIAPRQTPPQFRGRPLRSGRAVKQGSHPAQVRPGASPPVSCSSSFPFLTKEALFPVVIDSGKVKPVFPKAFSNRAELAGGRRLWEAPGRAPFLSRSLC